MTWIWIATGILFAVIIADWGYRQFASSRIRELIDNVPPFGVIDCQPTDSAEVFSIPTTDDLHLTASLHLPDPRQRTVPKGLILFCPELHGSHWTATSYCPALIEAGFAVLAFDFRNQGDSEYQSGFEPSQWSTESELSDLNSVLSFIAADESLKHLPLGAFGISRGGGAALVAACRCQQIQSVATDSAYDTLSLVQNFNNKFSRYVVPDWFFSRLPPWHVDWVLRQALRKSERRRSRRHECKYLRLASESHNFTQPALLISGKRDSYVTPAVTQRLAVLLKREDSIWIVPRAKHNKARSAAQNEYDARLVSHFEQTLPGCQATTSLSPESEAAASTG